MIYYNCCNILEDETNLSSSTIFYYEQENYEIGIKSKRKQLKSWYNKSKNIVLYSTAYILLSFTTVISFKIYEHFFEA
jgi:hypothetical protein